MVIDFSDLKKIVKEEIVDQFDHATVLMKQHRMLSSLWNGTKTEGITLFSRLSAQVRIWLLIFLKE
jgi:6-pyruvoyl-tetrahydropterin synthase